MKTRDAVPLVPVARRAAGFTLIELLVAMTVTLIISGSIVLLLNMGQENSRRMPAVVDRQQNIRAALMMIEHDVLNAGQQLPHWIQAFTNDLDGLGPVGPTGENSDFLQIVGNTGTCPNMSICSPGRVAHNTGVSITTSEMFPSCVNIPGLIMLSNQTEWAIKFACSGGRGGNNRCSDPDANDDLNGHAQIPAKAALRGWNSPGGMDWLPTTMSSIEVVRYEIRVDDDGTPNLWRSPNGGVSGASCTGGSDPSMGENWQLVARGIEDLQVQYRIGTTPVDGWDDIPGDVVTNNRDTLVREVRITLSGRTVGEWGLVGESKPSASAVQAVRGQLTTTVTPRAVLAELGSASGGAPVWR